MSRLKPIFKVSWSHNDFVEQHNEKIAEKFENEIDTLEKVKQREKNATLKKQQFLKSIKANVDNFQTYLKMLQQQDSEKMEIEEAYKEYEKMMKRRKFLRQKRKEYDLKFKSSKPPKNN